MFTAYARISVDGKILPSNFMASVEPYSSMVVGEMTVQDEYSSCDDSLEQHNNGPSCRSF